MGWLYLVPLIDGPSAIQVAKNYEILSRNYQNHAVNAPFPRSQSAGEIFCQWHLTQCRPEGPSVAACVFDTTRYEMLF